MWRHNIGKSYTHDLAADQYYIHWSCVHRFLGARTDKMSTRANCSSFSSLSDATLNFFVKTPEVLFAFWHIYVLWLVVYWWKRDVRATHESVTRRDVRASHDVTSDMPHGRQDFVKWLLHANAHPALRISQYDNSHPVRCFWILLEFRNTIVRVSGHVSFTTTTATSTVCQQTRDRSGGGRWAINGTVCS